MSVGEGGGDDCWAEQGQTLHDSWRRKDIDMYRISSSSFISLIRLWACSKARDEHLDSMLQQTGNRSRNRCHLISDVI